MIYDCVWFCVKDAATPSKQVVRNPDVRKVVANDSARSEEAHEIPFQHQIRNLQEEVALLYTFFFNALQLKY